MLTEPDDIRTRLLPAELAESELVSKPSAAVLVLLRPAADGLEVLLGQRARRQEDPWSGQIAFPGGHRHPEDPSLVATAIRETREETGLDLSAGAEVLGHLAPRSPGNVPQMLVVPFVAYATAGLHPNPGPEMAEMFWAPLAELPPSRGPTVVVTRIGELRVPAFLWRKRVIWGFTYRILEDLLTLLEETP